MLLIDDDTTTNVVNKRLLLTHGFAEDVITFDSGPKTLRFLRQQAQSGRLASIDLILLDLKMKVKDGYWFLDQYHKKTDIAKARLLVALTSSASFYDLERLKNYPEVSMHIYKPLTADHLVDLEEKLIAA